MREAGAARPIIAFLCAAFVAVGLSIASLGPALPEFAAVAAIDVSSIGVLYSALFAGFLLSQITSALLLERTGTRVVILWALAVFATGSLGLAMAVNVVTLLAASAVFGMGYGFGTIAINLVASRLLVHRPGLVVNLINVLYGVGTVIGPLITSWFLRAGGRARWVPAIGGLAAVILLPWAFRVLPHDGRRRMPEAIPTPRPTAVPAAVLLIGALVFMYGGVESGFSGWAPTYLERTLGVTPADAALATSIYWLSYVTGRVVSTALALRIGPAAVLQGALGALTVGGVVLALGVGHAGLTMLALVLLGVATGPIYPSMFGVVTQRFADRAAFAVSAVSTIGCGGAMLLPWVMGLTLPIAGGRVLAAIPLALALGMWAAYRLSLPRAATPS
ncbi:putative transporter [Luteitalea pratensis]|uniref:Putative transporter n=1 Tax=Luteitalea pratensis TaxID=1855912 RepID=A0A143PR19_LUTPR|nr:MFS transporter [Luteitalea pratensis]AMY10254.1 putative transporter [Luteitalea pratensis]